ncbi:MAG: transcriptional regulator [Saprospiraceae bacterium]|jgi:HTH-type transcriptional regulator/antitoxin HigA|nr:transcriptional regulator [Saprospiraceae bacterium]
MLKPLKNKEEHSTYLSRAYDLIQLDLSPDSKESDELEVISILIEAYEKENFPIESPNPIDAILFRLEQLGMTSIELSKLLGSRCRASEILNENRKLSIGMIRKLNEQLGISAQTLIKDYELMHG